MRYNNWDVILFPRDSHVPTQEFKTACYNSSDSNVRQSPTLTCYIGSLPPSTPFRISIHSWATAAKPSALIESRLRASQKIMYLVQVIVDGASVFRGLLDIASTWPQEIAQEKRTLTATEEPTSHRKAYLKFPRFLPQTLMQADWDCWDPNGRINIKLSEQIVSKNGNSAVSDMAFTSDIICFSFQHAPREILEQAGISWPIRNPLFLPKLQQGAPVISSTRDLVSKTMANRPSSQDIQIQSPLSHIATSAFRRPRNPEPLQRPNSLPSLHHVPSSTLHTRKVTDRNIWDDSFGSFCDSHDAANADSWSMQNSRSSGDVFMADYMFPTSHAMRNPPPRTTTFQENLARTSAGWRDLGSSKDGIQVPRASQVEQCGQIREIRNPPEALHGLPRNLDRGSKRFGKHLPVASYFQLPQAGHPSQAGRASATTLMRKPSYPDLHEGRRAAPLELPTDRSTMDGLHKNMLGSSYRASSNSSNKENFPPSQSRPSTSVPHPHRFPAPELYVLKMPLQDCEYPMRDGSSISSSFNRQNPSSAVQGGLHRHHSLHTTTDLGNIRSRKEGLVQHVPTPSGHDMRQDQRLLVPTVDKHKSTDNFTVGRPVGTSGLPLGLVAKNVPAAVEIIDVDAIDPCEDHIPPPDNDKLSPFQPNHKSGMSSIDSTALIERTLFNALGDFSTLDDHADHTDMRETVEETPGLHGETTSTQSPNERGQVAKRKRQDSLSSAQDETPTSKREKSRGDDTEHHNAEDLRKSRGS
ncbi:hypothetical protein EK21DRAFT_59648 [Setomelanomma holmii]|uniref:Uncharacterized protein n=1 Tax=Setomelanomma holmii TaxID=210430 RepID=A0A9P4LPA1_9PLEO|nr:hypothetical protein EK21DRAFT_59648 [Setomelanomma holmii]